MCVAAKRKCSLTPAARIGAAVAQAAAGAGLSAGAGLCRVEPLESRVLFAAGDLDATFGGTGTVTLDFFSRNDFGQTVAVQSDDKVLIAGWVATGVSSRGNDVAVARFNADGTLDTTFGGGTGKVTTHLGSTNDTAYALAVQSDGRVVVAGNTRGAGTGQDFAVVRYNADGSLDDSFGAGGIVRTDLGGLATDQATAMTLTHDGRIVVVGSTVIAGNQQFAAVRYTTAGQLDATFGEGDGIVVHPFTNGAGQAKAVTARLDGTIILAGALYDFGTIGSDFAAVRLFADGTLDASFGAAGWATVSMGGVIESAGAVVVQDSGHIVLVGEFSLDGEQDVALARLTAGGQIDPSFGGDGSGYVVTDFADGIDWATGAVLQTDGKIVVAGNGTVNGFYQMAVARFNPNGTPDTSFAGGKGTLTVPFDGATESFANGGIALDGQDRLIVGGHVARAAAFDMAVMRLGNALNLSPAAHAGGAYAVNPGVSVVLSGAGSTDADGSIVSYEWDFDYDGSSFDTDATGIAPTFSAVGLSAPAVRTVALRVTDNHGAAHVATATLTLNAAPIAHAGGAYLVDAGGSVILDGTGSSDVDGSIVSHEWDFDYDGSSFSVDATGAAPTFIAPDNAGGTLRTVALRCTDNFGATSVTTTAVSINPLPPPPPPPPLPLPPVQGAGTVLLVDDPSAPGRKMLSVKGTAGSDVIRLKEKKGLVEVRFGNKKLGAFSGITRVVVDAGAGSDVIDARGMNFPVALFGGAGDDYLVGGRGNDILAGGAGDDLLSGSFGNDLMVGGAGRDTLFSFLGNDLVVAGSLMFEDDLISMSAVLSEWSHTNCTLAQRVTHLTDGGGRNGAVKLGGGNVIDDNDRDWLFGTVGADWLLNGAGDRVQRIR